VEKSGNSIMQPQMNENRGRQDPRKDLATFKDSVVLHFNKVDSQIARNWSGSKTKDIFDDKN
jgi:hypothetical protein